MNQSKLWTKDFIIVSGVNFFLTLVFYLLIVIIGVYAVNEFQATTSQAGLVTGIFIVGTLIGRLFIGRFMDKIGRKKTLFIGLILYVLATTLYFIHLGVGFLLITRFLHGVTLGIAGTATGTIVAQIIPPSRKGEGIGYYSMSATLATAIGPFIGLYMTQNTTTNTIFALCLVLAIISLLTAQFVDVPVVKGTTETKEKGIRLSQFIEPNAVPIAVITLVVSLCYSSVVFYHSLIFMRSKSNLWKQQAFSSLFIPLLF